MEGGKRGKGCISGSDCHRGKIGNNFPPCSRCTGSADGRTDGRTERRTNWRAFRRSSCCPRADSIRRLRPPRPSVGKEGERLRFSLPSPMMIRPSTISQIQTSHETFSSVEREMYTFTIFQRWSDFLQSSCNLKRRNFSLCFLLLVLPTFVRIRHSLRPELLIWSPRASPPSDVR